MSHVFDKTALFGVQSQLNTIKSQRKISSVQSINQNKDNWSFFTFGRVFLVWELYLVIVQEVVLTIAVGLCGVLVLSFILLPNPLGCLIVTPNVAMIYVELLALLRVGKVYINVVSAVSLIICIGLVVDYSMHIVMVYFETKDGDTRDNRVKSVLTTIGSSVLVGGVTTLLGVLPLTFASTHFFQVFFLSFLCIPTLGLMHGLVLVPLVLSLVGPHRQSTSQASGPDSDDDSAEIMI